MKVDVVVNSMIQQIDRNLLSQTMPVLTFRVGEMLRGRVMLDAGDRPQIRLDSGELLSALPSGDVQLFAGATVTLRVTGNMDGQFVMQLMDQEIDGKAVSAQPQQAAGESLARLGLGNSAQGKAVLEAMTALRVPPREETARQALSILNANPRLGVEKAVFLAANGIAATADAITALNALVDGGATTGGELLKLANLLTSPASDMESAPAATPGTAAQAQPSAEQAQAPATQAQAPATQAQAPVRHAQPAVTLAQAPAGQAQPAATQEQFTAMQAQAPAAQAAPGLDVPRQGVAASTPAREYSMLELQSLVSVALGPEAVERYSSVISALQRQDYIGRAVGLALDGSLSGGHEFESALAAFTSALPQELSGEARAFVTALSGGLRSHAEANLKAPGDAGGPPGGLQRAVREIMDLFVKLDAGAAAGAQELRESHEAVRGTVERAAAEIREAGAPNPGATAQLGRVESHVRLIDNISQYIYRQIPMELNGRNRTVELYVMNRGGGGKRINPEKANILIALDTENMGRLETLIAVNGKNLRLRFGVENPALMGYVNSFTGDLDRAMREIGFRLSDMRAQVAAKPVTPLTAPAEAETFQESPGLDIKL